MYINTQDVVTKTGVLKSPKFGRKNDRHFLLKEKHDIFSFKQLFDSRFVSTKQNFAYN